jgi:hypothetical protein
MQSQRTEGLLSGLFGVVAVWPTMMFALVGVLIIVLRCFQWLKIGVWETYTLHSVLEWWIGRAILIDKFDSGLDKIVHWVLDGTPLMLNRNSTNLVRNINVSIHKRVAIG